MGKKSKMSEKLLLRQIAQAARLLAQEQRGLTIGQLIGLIRSQLKMSQRTVAKKAGLPQATLSKIESGRQQPTVATLSKILNALECDLLITAIPRNDLEEVRHKQAEKKATKRVEYLKGTMSLEEQIPDQRLLQEMVDAEVQKLLDAPGRELWGENL